MVTWLEEETRGRGRTVARTSGIAADRRPLA